MKIKISELKNLIKEEYSKLDKAAKLKVRLNEVNEELKSMETNEVEMDEVKKVGDTSGKEWYEKETPVAGFEKLKSKEGEPTATLKEDGEDEVEIGAGELETLAAELGKALDKKFKAEAIEDIDKAFEDAVEDNKAKDDEEKEETTMEAAKTEEGVTEVAKEEVKAESANAPYEEKAGEVDMKKMDKVGTEECEVKESINESVKPVIVENKLLTEELRRMKVLAKIIKEN